MGAVGLIKRGLQQNYIDHIAELFKGLQIKPEDRKPPVKFEFKDQTELDFFPVTAEVYVDKVLDRDAFRHLYNQCRSAKEVLTKLGASTNP